MTEHLQNPALGATPAPAQDHALEKVLENAPEKAGPVQYDLVISGGGMTGALLALVAKQQNPQLRIAVIEQTPAPRSATTASTTTESTAGVVTSEKASGFANLLAPKASFDSRSIALSAASVELLHSFGLWQQLKPQACAIEAIVVSDRGHFGKTRLNAADHQRNALGYVIEIEYIGAVLYQRLQQFADENAISWYRPASIAELAPPNNADWRELRLTDGSVLQTRLLALAEGGDAPGRTLAGIATKTDDYQQTALIANVAIRGSHQHHAYERFTSDGPVALLPLPAADGRQRYSLVWTLPHAKAEALASAPELDFLQALQQVFGYRAGEFVAVGNRVGYPLKLKQAATASCHRLVLCGNSLHNLHPIAGQGFNLALRDIAALQVLLQQHPDAGAYPLTRQYGELRAADMRLVIQLTDSLVRLFSNDSKLLALGRSLALSTLNHCSGLKTLFAEQTMGLTPLAQQNLLLQQAGGLAPRPAATPATILKQEHA